MLLLAACSDGGGAAVGVPSATVPTLPPQTTTTNPYDIPDVIDAAYVNRVLAGLDAAFGDIVREFARTRQLPESTLERLRAVYGDLELLNLQYGLLQVYARTNPFPLPTIPGNKKTEVSLLISAGRSCIFAEVLRDYSAFVGREQPRRTEWVALEPLSAAGSRPENATGWAYVYEGSDQSGRAPASSPCSSS